MTRANLHARALRHKGSALARGIKVGHLAKVAQSVEHVTENHGVAGSIPALGTTGAMKTRPSNLAFGGGLRFVRWADLGGLTPILTPSARFVLDHEILAECAS